MSRSPRQSFVGPVVGLLVGLVLAALAGCTGTTGGGPHETGSGGNLGAGGSQGAGGSGTGGDAVIDPSLVCKPGIPATSQIPRMTRNQYDTVVKDLLGVTTLSSGGAPSELLSPDSTGSMTAIAWTGYLTAAEKIAGDVMANPTLKASYMACDPAAGTCLADTIKNFGRKAFRRPLTNDEVTAFQAFNNLTAKGTPAEVAEAILYAFLASPSFIMLPELAPDKDSATGALKLTSYEVATRLSFLFWNSVPDDLLSQAADKGQLTSKDQIAAQAARLLKSPKATGVATTFHRAYVSMDNMSHWMSNNTKSASVPSYTAAAYNDAIAEIDAFFQDQVLNGGTFKDLFLSNSAFVTNATAPFYGLKATDFTATPKKTALDASKRPGFLTRVGFLSTFAHDKPSPILRGAFITQRVLGIPVGTPDPKFTMVTPPDGNYRTNRESVTALTMGSPCNTCHTTKINPPGFVLENFDGVGAWQDTDALGGPIDPSADVMLSVTDTKKLSTVSALMTDIASSANAQRMYAQSWVIYATGRSPNTNDQCIVDQLTTSLGNASYPITGMMTDYAQADSFRLRTAAN